MAKVRIGISGWTYPPWRGVFYPEKWPHKRELEYASRKVSSIEINGTFYSLQSAESFGKWYDTAPADFIFSVKGGRFITHIRKLKEVEVPLARFFGSGVLLLAEKLGPFLWQLPPQLKFDRSKVETFFRLLPRTFEEAAKLAQQAGGATPRTIAGAHSTLPLRHAMEVRHDSFATEEFMALALEYNVAIVVADTAYRWPLIEETTSDFVYVRLHGDEELYADGYTEEALNHWAAKVKAWWHGEPVPTTRSGKTRKAAQPAEREVFVYFDNDVKVCAPRDAQALARLVEQKG